MKALKAILVRPRFDSATEYTFAFASEVFDRCQEAGMEVLELAETDAVRSRVEEGLGQAPDLFIFFDHGDEGALIGQDEKAVIDLKNCKLLANRETYTLACLSAKKLGAEVWSKGGKYWGYTEIVSFTSDALTEFREAFNCGFRFRFLEGDSHQNTLQRARATFDLLTTQLVEQGKIMAAVCMNSNRDALVYLDAEKPGEEPEGCLVALVKMPLRLLRRGWPG